MKTALRLLACGLLLACGDRAPVALEPAPATPAVAWSFDSERAGEPPAGFQFLQSGGGAPGQWRVRDAAGAPSPPRVLAQLDLDATEDRYLLALAEAPPVRDLRLSVRCRPIAGAVDQACGLVFRCRGAGDYYLTRANALEGNIRLYFVKDGVRKQLQSWSGTVVAGAWHEYAVEMRGDSIRVTWDGALVLEARDSTFAEAGHVGLWTKADSVSEFDDLRIEPLAPPTAR